MSVFASVFLHLVAPDSHSARSESAATLEAESGYTMESSEVSEFRQCILDGAWDSAEAALMQLGVADEDGLWVSIQLGLGIRCTHHMCPDLGVQVSHQSAEVSGTVGSREDRGCLEHPPSRVSASKCRPRSTAFAIKVGTAFPVPASVPSKCLASLLMCADSTDLRQRANWDGASGTSRRRLLVDLQRTWRAI